MLKETNYWNDDCKVNYVSCITAQSYLNFENTHQDAKVSQMISTSCSETSCSLPSCSTSCSSPSCSISSCS